MGIVNIELNENMEFACPPSISPSGAQRVSRVGRPASSALKSQATLQLENLALRHQLGVLRRSVKRPKLTSADRLLWVWLCEVWSDWRSSLMIVKPETVIAWHHKGFRLFWRWKSKPTGRPRSPTKLRQLIKEMAAGNVPWGEERIANELTLKLGILISPRTVGKYLQQGPKRREPVWCANIPSAIELNEFRAVLTDGYYTLQMLGKPMRNMLTILLQVIDFASHDVFAHYKPRRAFCAEAFLMDFLAGYLFCLYNEVSYPGRTRSPPFRRRRM